MSALSFTASAGSPVRHTHAEADVVRIAVAHHQPEAERIQRLLRAAGVSSTVQRTPGFDVPEKLASGPRDILVPRSAVDDARYVLLRAGLDDRATMPPLTRRGRILFGLEGVLAALSALALLVGHVIG
jgi:hypothetical protein